MNLHKLMYSSLLFPIPILSANQDSLLSFLFDNSVAKCKLSHNSLLQALIRAESLLQNSQNDEATEEITGELRYILQCYLVYGLDTNHKLLKCYF